MIALNDNTNRWGTPPAAATVIRTCGEAGARYPELYARSLKQALAAYAGVAPDMIVTGCGSDDVLDAAFRVFAEPGERIAIPDPTFVMVPVFAQSNRLVPVRVPLDAEYGIDVDAMLHANAKVVYVCSPNNPTGTAVPRTVIESIAARTSGVLIIDEAYAEFADANALDLARTRDNVLVVRTMSKAFGLAGLRVGYGIGAPELVARIERSRGPFQVNAVASAAVIAALDNDLGWVRDRVRVVQGHREHLVRELNDREIAAVPSHANFVFAPISNATAIVESMQQHGVAIRAFPALPMVSPALRATGGDAIRISIGPWAEMESALAALDASRTVCV